MGHHDHAVDYPRRTGDVTLCLNDMKLNKFNINKRLTMFQLLIGQYHRQGPISVWTQIAPIFQGQ